VSYQSSALEDLTERICQQYSDMLSKKLEERLLDRLAAKLQGQQGGQAQLGAAKAAAGQLQSRRGTQQQ
jgi:hypothetical protein